MFFLMGYYWEVRHCIIKIKYRSSWFKFEELKKGELFSLNDPKWQNLSVKKIYYINNSINSYIKSINLKTGKLLFSPDDPKRQNLL